MMDTDSRFTFRSYAADHAFAFAFATLALAIAAFMLGILGLNAAAIGIVVAFLALCCIAIAVIDYRRKRAFWNDLIEVVEHLEHARHLSAFIDKPSFLEARIADEALGTLARQSGEELAQAKEDSLSYRRYVEAWIHEVKTPIAASRLILARMKGPDATALRQELEDIESSVEQALYYARCETVSSDYAIRSLALADVVREACKRNQNLLISHGVSLEMNIPDDLRVFSDPSWLTFILSQLLANSAKYRARTIRFSAQGRTDGSDGRVVLEVLDDGVGISAQDAPKVFERGFVGENGRAQGSATGMGLYLCARLCEALGMRIELFSEQGSHTRVMLTFPQNESELDAAAGVVLSHSDADLSAPGDTPSASDSASWPQPGARFSPSCGQQAESGLSSGETQPSDRKLTKA